MDKLLLLVKFLAFCVAFVVGIFLVLLILAMPVLVVRAILRRKFPDWAKRQDEVGAAREARQAFETRLRAAHFEADSAFFERDKLAKCGSDVVRQLLKDRSEYVRKNAAVTLGFLRDEKSVPDLVALAFDLDREVRRTAIRSLGLIGGELAEESLVRFMQTSNDSLVREEAVRTFGQIGSPRVVEVLSNFGEQIKNEFSKHEYANSDLGLVVGEVLSASGHPAGSEITEVIRQYKWDQLSYNGKKRLAKEHPKMCRHAWDFHIHQGEHHSASWYECVFCGAMKDYNNR